MKMALGRIALVIKVVGEMLFFYGLLAWADGVVVQFTNPMLLAWPVSHLLLWIRTDTFTILSFLVSALGFLMWKLSAELIKFEQNKASDKSSAASSA
jgi:hypothetical protein